jgi:hypothetical protein
MRQMAHSIQDAANNRCDRSQETRMHIEPWFGRCAARDLPRPGPCGLPILNNNGLEGRMVCPTITVSAVTRKLKPLASEKTIEAGYQRDDRRQNLQPKR